MPRLTDMAYQLVSLFVYYLLNDHPDNGDFIFSNLLLSNFFIISLPY